MAIKFECPRCGRKFTEWGAERLGFKCPHDAHCPKEAADEEIELIRSGGSDDKHAARASLKRTPAKRKAAIPKHSEDDEAIAPDVEEMEEDEKSDDDDVDEESDAVVGGDDESADTDAVDEAVVVVGDDDEDVEEDTDDIELDDDEEAEEELDFETSVPAEPATEPDIHWNE
jgi:hypothetical protein